MRDDDGDLFTEAELAELVNRLSLPPRQADLMRLLLKGASDKRIAKELGISHPTVRTHFSRLFAKLGVEDRNEATLTVIRTFFKGCQSLGCPRHPRR